MKKGLKGDHRAVVSVLMMERWDNRVWGIVKKMECHTVFDNFFLES